MTQLLLAIIVFLFGLIAYLVKQILDKTTELEKDFKPVPPAIVEIQGKFTDTGHSILFPLTVKPGSPLELTEYGQKLVDDSGFEKILTECRETLVNKVKAKRPKTNYDIQQQSIQVIEEMLEKNDEILNPIKEYAFNNGLKVDIFVAPAGVLLRDAVMKELKF